MIKSRKNQNENLLQSNMNELLMDYINNVESSELIENLHLFIPRVTLSRVLAIEEIYKKIIGISGIVLEFGCRYGGNMALYNNFKSIYEPYNYTRQFVGFDTFSGFPSVSDVDVANTGDYAVKDGYMDFLSSVLDLHNKNSPIGHIEKNLLIKGDVQETLGTFLGNNTRNFALVYFDMDLYSPTVYALNLIKPFLSKGSIIVFDDFNNDSFKGESKAVLEVFGNYNDIKLHQCPFYPRLAYLIF